MATFHEFNDLAVLMDAPRSASFWRRMPDDVDTIFHATRFLQDGVTRRATEQGINAFFGTQTALHAFYALAVWFCNLPPDDQAAIEAVIGRNGDKTQ